MEDKKKAQTEKEIAKEETVEETTKIDDTNAEPVVEETATLSEVEVPVIEETTVVESSPVTIDSADDIITLSNENVEPEDLQTAVVEQPAQEEIVVPETPAIEPIPVEEQELSIGAMFGENSSQTTTNNDNIVLDNDLSVELDQYLKDLDLPNS